LTPGLFFLGPVALATLPALFVSFFLPAWAQVLVFIGGTVASLAILRPIARSHLRMPALTRTGTAALFSLPGNPVSALVAFELLVRPALGAMLGRKAVREPVRARLIEPFTQRRGRLHLVRAWLEHRDGEATVRPLGPHAAGSLGSLAGANAWMVVAPDVERLEAGTVVETWPMLPS